ncbi:CAP domain-containing protein [Lentinula lateritia]|uniref:CAP domain-containing protein n=1 Tax=Lentinula lateritia TaxID=40482 RepID=A0ABQ8VQV6_9AGAR|nr:CAP domain-containing protein [Lentinula lateritia]
MSTTDAALVLNRVNSTSANTRSPVSTNRSMSLPPTKSTSSSTSPYSRSASIIATTFRPTSIGRTNPIQTSTELSGSSRASSNLTNLSASRSSSVQTSTRLVSSSSSASTSSLTSPSLTASATSGATVEFIQSTLKSHNTARAQYGASSLTSNSNLYLATQQWANACVFQHSGGNYGENLAAAAPQGISVQQGVNMWMAEASQYNYSNPTFSSSTGHFTQVVWKSTTSVACAIATCNFLGNGTGYLVCRYDPPGNYLGQFAQNVGRTSS